MQLINQKLRLEIQDNKLAKANKSVWWLKTTKLCSEVIVVSGTPYPEVIHMKIQQLYMK